MTNPQTTRVFYGWWIATAAFLNLFFAVGIIFYGFPFFYPAFVESLGLPALKSPKASSSAWWWLDCRADCWRAP
jgi:hypothetical protein